MFLTPSHEGVKRDKEEEENALKANRACVYKIGVTKPFPSLRFYANVFARCTTQEPQKERLTKRRNKTPTRKEEEVLSFFCVRYAFLRAFV